jgi:signal transduction histidine kinase/CheY-like chemotaxis protein
MKLRWHVVVLVMLTMLPMLVLALGLISWNAHIQRRSVEHGMQQTVGAMAFALDQELQVTIAALQALAADASDSAQFRQTLRERVQAVRAQHPAWASVGLSTDDGYTVLPLLQQQRASLPSGSWKTAEQALESGQPRVSNLYRSVVLNADATAIHVPLGGRHADATLAAVIPSEHWVRFLQQRLIPPGWVAGIVDRDGIVIARSRAAEERVGKPVPDWVLEAINSGDSGQCAGPAFEGQPVSLVYHRSTVSGWTVAFAAPTAVFEGPLRQAQATAIAVGLGFGVVACGLGLLYARRVVRPITALSRSSTALGRFERLPQLPDTAVEEINHLYRTMAQSGEDMAEAAVARSRAEEGERHAREMAAALARQKNLELSARQLEHASAMKSQFLANMSHEIRTPLNAILGTALLLERSVQDDVQQRYVGTIRTAGRALLDLVNDVLDLSRIEAGRLELEHSPFVLGDVLRGVIDVLAPTAQDKGLQLVLEPLPEDLPALAGDARRLGQVVYNLVGNAIKFTEVGGVTMEVETLHEDAERVELRLAVRDTGIGIAADRVERIFDAFVQADSSTSRRYGGTGLGLAICRQVVDLMGGKIGVLSQPGVGSEFWLRVRLDLAAAAAPGLAPPVRSWGARRLSGIHVMVVDDAPANLDVTRGLLEAEGAVCVTAGGGDEALQLLRAAPGDVDVVLMDVHMPELDGVEATRLMRADVALADVPVIALTASALASQRERALAAGMNGYLAKPFDVDNLVSLILRWTAPQRRPGDTAVAAVPALAAAGAGLPAMAGINGEQAQRRLLGNRALFLRLLRALREEFAEAAAVVRADLQHGDAAQAAMRMHKLCGLAGNLGAEQLCAAARQVESALRAGEHPRLDMLLGELQAALATVVDAIAAQDEAVPDAEPVDAPSPASQDVPPPGLAALVAALEDGDTIALDQFEALRGALTAWQGDEAVACLERTLYGLRLRDAGVMLRAWLATDGEGRTQERAGAGPD